MAKRQDHRQIAKLAQVQHVRKAAAEASMMAASAAETVSETEHADAEKVAVLAIGDWLGCMAQPWFEPERARDLAAVSVEREGALDAAVSAHADATELRERRVNAWRQASARVELTDTMAKDARRAAGRAREERRLTQLCDRVTFAWSQS
ncbi:hypothetical protein DBR17_01165 [Sphingomonas sp. HMWF008]|nr:hypothetical protein DBR17_01165 [Sphingomonas sp. HMWF008]